VAELSKAIARLMEERAPTATDPPQLRAVIERVRALVTPMERLLVDAFTRQLFSRGSADLLAAGDPQIWAALALDAFHFVSQGSPEPRVRVFNPQVDRNGWDSPDTVVQTNMGDRPFIVDTIRDCVLAKIGPIHRLLHPIFSVERDRTGALQSVGPPEVVGRNESFVHVEIGRVGDPSLVQATLTAHLGDVIAATDDYQAMRTRAGVFAQALRARPLPRPWNEDVVETAAFLDWLAQKSFVFLGYREYEFSGQGAERRGAVRHGSGLGILRDEGRSTFATPQPIAERLRRRINEPPLLLVSKTNAESPVHRRARMDYIGLKQVDDAGVVIGEHRFLGLFTAKAYGEESAEMPLLRRKLEAILTAEEAVTESHDYRAIIKLYNTIPKEELFGSSAEELRSEIATIRAADAEGIRVVCRSDALGRGQFVVVILPRDRFSSNLYERVEGRLRKRLGAVVFHQHAALDDFDRARLHFYFGAERGVELPEVGAEDLERDLRNLLRTWDDRLADHLQQEMSRVSAQQLAAKYLPAFSDEYRAATDIPLAVRDIRCLEALAATRAPQVDVTNETSGDAARFTAVKLYLLDAELVLSDFLPMLENLGLKVFEEDHLDVPLDIGTVRIHTFLVHDDGGGRLDVESAGTRLAAALLALRAGQVDNDALNRLVLHAGLHWREVDLLRAYVGHAQQAQIAAREVLVEALAGHPEPARLIFEGFRTKFDPAVDAVPRVRTGDRLPAVEGKFLASLDAVEGALHDRILRALWTTMTATVRTNFYLKPAASGPPRPGTGTIAIKIKSAELPHLPRPHPLFEIFVHAAHVAGIHLRNGPVARGGIRLSDRPTDFRTEVLDLMKTQTVKNAVIVPTGAKGGFVLKRRPTGASTSPGAISAAYRSFIGGLLDLTDNIVQGSVVPPAGVLAYDGPDPYLVVAADKGTATFSDTANEIAAAYGFWLGDAFASGGSHGYDHKKEAITAKGAWESVRHHFRALGRDADSEPLTVIGIGDMSGDVFGNGLLRSPHLQLRAAFNHLHIFLDPDPDPAAAFAEREHLFHLPRSGWNDYNPAVISRGGGVFPRAAKKINLSPEATAMLGLDRDTGINGLSGEELIRAVLCMEADLLWNGGIGTYVKAQDETHAEVGDAGNDAVRIDATQLRVKVVAEGGNLGFSQRGRVEYALAGGRINTDAIDNSAGVDLSDHEVNLKIALGRVVEAAGLDFEGRNALLAELTDQVCEHVLADNRRQVRALTIDQFRSRTRLADFRDLIAQLEAEAQLDRQLERLPNREALRQRRAVFLGLTRPELAVVLAYSKLHLQHQLLQSSLTDDVFLERLLRRYFPDAVNNRYGEVVRAHRLRREIIAVTLANWLIDAMGVTFVTRIAADTGSDALTVVKAWTAAITITGTDEWIDRLLEGKPPLPAEANIQSALVLEQALERATKWIVETQPPEASIGDLHAGFATSVGALQHGVNEFLPAGEQQRDRAVLDALMSAGVPPSLAQPLVGLRRTAELLEIDQISSDLEAPLEATADAYYRVGGLVDLEWVQRSLQGAAGDDRWQRRAVEGLAEGLVYARRQITRNILLCRQGGGEVEHCLADYVDQHRAQLDKLQRLIGDIKSAPQITLATLVVVMRELGRLTAR
jgi:glutamate dehydrogenase